MKKTEFIGIAKGCKASKVANLAFLLLKNNGFKVGLISKKIIKVNETIAKEGIVGYEDIEKMFDDEADLDYVILDDLKTKCLNDFIVKYRIDTVIDDGIVEKEIENSHIINKKRTMLNNLKRNGIIIINNDNKALSNYFNSLKDKVIISYGLNAKSTITASSLDINEEVSFNCCIQRGLTTSNKNEIEQMEFPIKLRYYNNFEISYYLSAIGLALIYEIPVAKIQETIYKLNEDDFK